MWDESTCGCRSSMMSVTVVHVIDISMPADSESEPGNDFFDPEVLGDKPSMLNRRNPYLQV